MPDVSGYTAAMPLCDPDGIVRSGEMHHGTDYPCTGSAHYAGEHIRCTSAAHARPTVGRIVHMLVDPAINNGSDVAPAVITRAFEQCINVRVLLDATDKTLALTSVPLHKDRASADAWCATRRDELRAAGYPDPIRLSVAFWPPRV